MVGLISSSVMASGSSVGFDSAMVAAERGVGRWVEGGRLVVRRLILSELCS